MFSTKEYFRQYDRIREGRENEGYFEWKEKIQNDTQGLDNRFLFNWLKREELELKYRSEKEQSPIMAFAASIVTLLVTAITLGITVMTSTVTQVFSFYGKAMDRVADDAIKSKEAFQQAMKLVEEVSITEVEEIVTFMVVLIVAYFIAYICMHQRTIQKNHYRVFLEEFVKILRKECDNRNIEY